MDPGVLNSLVSSVAMISCLGIVSWTIVTLTKNRRDKSIPPGPSTELLKPMEQRLERLEQATEAIALEVERIAEGQRFVTKLLSDSGHDQARIGSGR